MLGPPGNAPSDYRDGGTRYVSQIAAATTNPPGSKAVTQVQPLHRANPRADAGAKHLAAARGWELQGILRNRCRPARRTAACFVSFSLAAGGKRINGLRFEPPACLVNNNTSTTLPVNSDGSFNVTITFNHGAPKFTIQGKIVSASKATATISATCAGKTTTRTLTLSKSG